MLYTCRKKRRVNEKSSKRKKTLHSIRHDIRIFHPSISYLSHIYFDIFLSFHMQEEDKTHCLYSFDSFSTWIQKNPDFKERTLLYTRLVLFFSVTNTNSISSFEWTTDVTTTNFSSNYCKHWRIICESIDWTIHRNPLLYYTAIFSDDKHEIRSTKGKSHYSLDWIILPAYFSNKFNPMHIKNKIWQSFKIR